MKAVLIASLSLLCGLYANAETWEDSDHHSCEVDKVLLTCTVDGRPFLRMAACRWYSGGQSLAIKIDEPAVANSVGVPLGLFPAHQASDSSWTGEREAYEPGVLLFEDHGGMKIVRTYPRSNRTDFEQNYYFHPGQCRRE